MSAHTPGPWKQRTGPEGTREIVGGRHGLEFVCQYGHESTSDEIVEADGALIAAALVAGRARAMRLRMHAQRSPLAGSAVRPVPDAASSRGRLWDGSSQLTPGSGSAAIPGPTSESTKARR